MNVKTSGRAGAFAARIAWALGLVSLLLLATRDYLGARHYEAYLEARKNVRSIQSGLPELEGHLRRAVRIAPRRAYLEALGSLYLDAALAENQSGSEEKRDAFLDKARDVLLREIAKYPVAAYGYYNLGRVYMLYNYPLLTYATKGREYYRKALSLEPADEFMNVTVLTLMLGHWGRLGAEEKADVWRRLGDTLDHNEGFLRNVRGLWMQSYGNLARLREIYAENPDLAPRLKKYAD
jgi:tetratricopeptide (TPR) repeat protein